MASSDEELMTSQSNVNETLSTTEQSKEGNSSHVAVPDSAHVSESEALRRSRRDTKLTLKAREQKVLVLSQRLVKIVDEFQEQSETFSVAAESKELHDVQAFVSQMEHKSHAICSTFDEIKTLSENKVESVTQNLFEQFIAESQQLRDYLQQREERHEENERMLQEEEAALQEAKAQLEEQMKQLQARMAARQLRLLRKTSSDNAESTQQPNQATIQTAPPLPTRRRRSVLEADIMPQNSHVSNQPIRRQEHQPVRASAIELNRESTSEQPILPQTSRNSFQAQHEALGGYQVAQQWSPTTATSQQNMLNKAEDIADAVTERMHISLLAPPEPFVFSGDPLQYADWRASFNGLIHSKKGTPIEKLHRLRKYVSGEALEAISGYFRLQTTNAYEEALATLQEEFGRDDLVENGFRDKLEGWPKIGNKDQVALKKYSYFLRQCLAAQAAIPNLKALDEKRENKKFIKALPGWAINRWMYYVTDQEEKGGFPPFSKYVEFVAREARVSNNNLRDGSDSKPNSKSKANISDKPQNARSYRSNASKAEDCIFCHKNSHVVTECRSLAAKSEEDKKKFIMERRLCFGCIKPGHSSKSCSERATCGKCGKAHPTALHQERSSTKEKAIKQESTKEKQIQPQRSGESVAESKKVNANAAKQGQSRLLSMIVPVYVRTSLSEQLVYALLDTQSDVSFISQSLASKLKPMFTPERITITTLNGQKTKLLNRYKLTVRGFGLAATEELEIEAYEQECIPCTPTQIPNRSHVADLPHLKSLLRKLPPKMDIPVGLLIGVDCSKALAPLETILGQEGQPFAVKTKLGWTLCGEISKPVQEFTVHNTQIKQECVLDDHSLGQPKLSQHDLQFLDTLERGITKLESGSYCLPLPFKDKSFMPNNKAQAEKRLKQLVERFKRDEEYKNEYFSFVKDMVDNGFAEVAADEADKGKEWYIPHFGIYHPKKRKLRVVFDASARYANESLNEKLLTGPDHMNSLVGILLRFRKNPIAISCDVEKMFHNFYVPEAHRDYLRFLWIDPDLKSVSVYRMTRHLFGATSSPGVATFALRHIARQHEHEKPSASRFIIKDFYVDDGITSVNTTEEAVNLIVEATDICNSGNLRLHKFVSNSREVMAAIPPSEVVQEAQGLNLFHDRLPTERTLGIEWSIQTDTIEFKNNLKFTAPTRRGILSAVSQLYDPLGLLSPFTLKGKMISQKACQEKGEWDAEVSMQLQEQWQEWVNELDNLDTVKIDRCVQAKDLGRAVHTELHHFSDASLQGYGACTYLRMVDEHSKVHVTLLMAKGRVAPTKLMTIPRLELQAAVEAAKLSATLKAELDMKIDEEYFWSDSAVALGYIKNSEHRYHMFVANRVQTIRSNSECEQWHHVPGKANPADLVSRGASLFSLQKSAWWDGPQFLHAPDIRKHLKNEYSGETLPEDPEIKRPKQALCARKAQPEERKLNFERHGSWTKLIRAIATAKTMLKNRSWRKPNLDVFQLQEAEKIVIKLTQREYYRDELKALESSQSVHKQSSLLCLTPFLDKQGMMRIGGRARRSLALSFEEKHPLILPEKAHVSKLLIERAHQKVYHQGQAMTLGALRTQGYWITAANKLVKRHIHQCAPCRAMRAPAVQQQMGELPQSRIEPTPPFTHIGMDCFGPYTVKDRRIEVKRWGLLLTCMYSRAIHIELLDSMSTDALINALRSFICIRGPVKTICCDNGTNFIGAKNELLASFASLGSGIQDALKDSMIEFKFNAPSASHAGGVWERQIRTVKSVLNAMLPTYTTRMDTMALKTAFYEVMAIVNSRPLSVDNLNKPDEIVLTPNHLITMKPSQPTVVPGEFDNQEVYGRKMWRKVQQFAEHFWTEWRNQYFVHINKRQKWTKIERSIAIGDIVLIMDENLPRGQWLTAVVQQVFKDNDALVRRAQLRVANRHLDRQGKKMTEPSVLERPVQKLILLVPAIDS